MHPTDVLDLTLKKHDDLKLYLPLWAFLSNEQKLEILEKVHGFIETSRELKKRTEHLKTKKRLKETIHFWQKFLTNVEAGTEDTYLTLSIYSKHKKLSDRQASPTLHPSYHTLGPTLDLWPHDPPSFALSFLYEKKKFQRSEAQTPDLYDLDV